MTEIFWTPRASDDLAGIRAYISQDSPHYAELVTQRITAAMSRLEQFPESGRIVPELGRPEIREIIWRSYRIVYRSMPTAAQVHVLTVFRSEQLFPGLPEIEM